ncbi:MAG: alpha/beta family hydrolase [Pseudomonadota bacterium]
MLRQHLKSKKLGGAYVQHLGELDAHAVLVVIGRNNYKKKSATINTLAAQLHLLGLTVCWYERKANQHARLRDEEFSAICGSWFNTFCDDNPIAGYLARKVVRFVLKIKYPKRHFYFFKRINLDPNPGCPDFRRFIRQLKVDKVFVLAHSAGGIVASLAASEAAIRNIICFGYPFKHPEKPDEAYRTAHLKEISKPFLIIQGNQDEYGSAEDAMRYTLSPSVHIESIQSGHDYDAIEAHELENLTKLVASFVGVDVTPHR